MAEEKKISLDVEDGIVLADELEEEKPLSQAQKVCAPS